MATLNASRYRPVNANKDRIRIVTDTKLQGSYILPTHTLRMLGLVSENEMVGQERVTPPTDPGNTEWTYEFTVSVVDRD